MIQKITNYIEELERQMEIKVLLAVESGSRSWGFPSADSDFDVRLIYVHHPEWYFHVTDHKDTIEYMSADRIFDLSGWELRKALNLMAKTNPGMTDWLFTDIIYKADDEFLNGIRSANDMYYNPLRASYHYASMARNLSNVVSKGEMVSYKKYLYFLRAILNTNYLIMFEKRPPVRFQQLMQSMNIPSEIREKIESIIDEKFNSCEGDVQLIDSSLLEYATSEYESIVNRLTSFKPLWSYPDDGLKRLDELATKYITSVR